MLRYNADVRSVFYMILTSSLLIILWQWSSQMNLALYIIVYGLQLLMAIAVSVMSHNHQHLPMWTNKWLNRFTDNWLTVFYGLPVFVWIPTHNVNHHVYINKEPDYTKTYRYSEKNNMITMLSYPSISGYFQQIAIVKFFKALRKKDQSKFYTYCFQIFVLVSWVGVSLFIDWKKALMFVVIPQQVSLFTVLIFNYFQHVHTDEETEFNNSRNFTGSILNFILLNNGYHTAHHVNAGWHWSLLPEKHQELAPKIDPVLNENDIGWFMLRNYLLGIFIPSLRTSSMRVARMENTTAT